ncbi:MAG: prohibitin family protein [Clostridia bacterium]|nr:prohibitin family protein [Clostridia bacterium]
MLIGFIVAFALIALFAAGLVLCIRTYGHKKNYANENRAAGKAGIALMVVSAVLFAVLPMSIHTVDTGEVAVVKHLGDAKNVRAAGTHFDFWLTDVYQIYDAKVQNVDITTNTYSSDAQTMDVQMTIQYQIMSDRVIDIARQYGSLELLENRIKSISIEKAKAVLSSHKAMDIIADRAAMSPAVEKAIKDAIDENYFVDVTTVVITNIDFSEAFENAVEDKMIAEQKQLQAEYENRTKVAKAKADADARLIEAEAAAEANRLLEASLTEKILQQMYIEKWDGELPATVAGQDVMLMLPTADAVNEE